MTCGRTIKKPTHPLLNYTRLIYGSLRCWQPLLAGSDSNLFFHPQEKMEILGGMMPQDDTFRQQNLAKAYQLGRDL